MKFALMLLTDLKYLILELRPRHWIKNLFIFAGLFFSRQFFDLELLMRVGLGFILFSLAASSVYIFNDILDLAQDRKHPAKRQRPLAAGRIGVGQAAVTAVILAASAVIGAFLLNKNYFATLVIYMLMNLAYSLKIKHVVILDILFIAFGFILRVLAGVALARVYPSDWLIICAMTLALFLGFTKRRQELVFNQNNGTAAREVLSQYSIAFLDQMIAVVTACTIIAYALYTVAGETVARFGTRNLVATVPFVLYGIFRYFYLIHQQGQGEDPTTLVLRDKPTLVNLLLWLITVAMIIY